MHVYESRRTASELAQQAAVGNRGTEPARGKSALQVKDLCIDAHLLRVLPGGTVPGNEGHAPFAPVAQITTQRKGDALPAA
jgi:hypothetical protein